MNDHIAYNMCGFLNVNYLNTNAIALTNSALVPPSDRVITGGLAFEGSPRRIRQCRSGAMPAGQPRTSGRAISIDFPLYHL